MHIAKIQTVSMTKMMNTCNVSAIADVITGDENAICADSV